MYAARNTPLVAIESGKISRLRTGGLGGIAIWMRTDGGDDFYYAHLEAWADGLHAGQRVEAGELIGYVGNSGNAQGSLPHVHLQYHPNGGAAVNPYPIVAPLCL
jgi:murein DD-endopeptidase MepM/ murein hydrolase activator NlpD